MKINDQEKKDLGKVRLFSNRFCFMDNFCDISNHREFTETLRIYILQGYNSKRKTFQLPKHHL